MSWDAIGAIGEVLGATAVVVSVWYLALQVRKQIKESRLAATRELAAQYLGNLDIIVQDEKFSVLWGKAVQNYTDLPNDERLRVALHMQRITRVREGLYLHISHENVDSEYFKSVQLAYHEGLTFPGYQQWWETARNLFDSKFSEHVDRLLVDAKERGYTSTFASSTESPSNNAINSDA